jgi:hydroxymethylpyrimidine/phosphomethylpyrimidine kinase
VDVPVALTIAGTDPSGGAGLAADLKTFQAFGVYGAAVTASLVAQDTTGVRAFHDVDPEFVVAQLDAVVGDLGPAATKTGLLRQVAVVEAVAARLRAVPPLHLVVDPVIVATSGDTLVEPGAAQALQRRVLPLASLVTPNLEEAAALSGRAVASVADMREAARVIAGSGARAVLVKGGHLADRVVDVLLADGDLHEIEGPRIPIGPTHGTGCTLSAAITAGLALGLPLTAAVERAVTYVRRALVASPRIGHGSRPLAHWVPTTGGPGRAR